MNDALMIGIAVVAAVVAAGVVRRVVSSAVRTVTSILGMLVVAWVVCYLLGIDFPALLRGLPWPSWDVVSGWLDTARAWVQANFS